MMKNIRMLKIMYIIISIVIFSGLLVGCKSSVVIGNIIDKGIDYVENFNYGGDPIQFESFYISEQGMSAERFCYEGYKTVNGVHLEHFLLRSYWDGYEEKEERNTIHAVEGGQELYDELCALLGNCRINKWNGFHGGNPPGVLDGSSMKFEALLSDGTELCASGTNNFPQNYGTLMDNLYELTCTQMITDTHFDNGDYKIILPDNWINVVTAKFSFDYTAFSVKKSDGECLTFFIIDDSSYGYESGDDDIVRLGRLFMNNTNVGEEKVDNVRYLDARQHYSLDVYADDLGEEERRIAENYNEDINAVIDSLEPSEGYSFAPEDGNILYYSDARKLFDSAKSLWLYAFIRAEYAGSEEPVKIDGKNYMLIYPQYYGNATPEGVKKKFLEYFSEEYVDRLISQSEANKDMIVKDGSVYVSCRVFGDDHVYFNSWVDDVEDNNDGSFNVIVKARKSVETEDHGSTYVDDVFQFPAKKNDDGHFVFTDFPYWEKTVEK